jgi:hypothetical protein
MSLENLERKQKALEKAIEAHKTLRQVLPELPYEWVAEIIHDLVHWETIFVTEGPLQAPPQIVPKHKEPEPIGNGNSMPALTVLTGERLMPTEAILKLLSSRPTEGFKSGEIISKTIDIISTTSENPKRLLYSALNGLKKRGKIVRLPSKRYVIKR